MGVRGPAPDPNALRRDRPSDAAGWTTLPAVCTRKAPTWPLAGKPSARESVLWRGLWRKPQAEMWHRLGLAFEVGLYVRRLTEVEQRGAAPTLGSLVKQMSEELGISSTGLARRQWKIAVDELEDRRAAPAARGSVRGRVKAAPDAAGA